METAIYSNISLVLLTLTTLFSLYLYIKGRKKINQLNTTLTAKLDDIENFKELLSKKEIDVQRVNRNLTKKTMEHGVLTKKLSETNVANESLINKLNEMKNTKIELMAWKNKYGKINDTNSEFLILKRELEDLRGNYSSSMCIYKKLKNEIEVLNESLTGAEFGFYERKHQFGSSDEYKNALKTCIERQKTMCKDMTSVIFLSIDDFNRKTKINPNSNQLVNFNKNTYPFAKNALRAFNSECEQIIQTCKWNNINRLSEKINKIRDKINKNNEFRNFTICSKNNDLTGEWTLYKELHIRISDEYLRLKIEELELFYERQLEKKRESEEQAEFRAKIREEAKAKKEYEQEFNKAEKEEETFQNALNKIKLDVQKSHGKKLKLLEIQIAELTESLLEANERKERALSMAQQTRRGHVYIISNVGTMGKGVLKIGMTRRLNPLDRITELGDASVPFKFDLHAMISTDDAPALEKALHKAFESKRVNLTNNRKEFFYVTIDEIKNSLPNIYDKKVDIYEGYLAEEYYQSEVLRNNQKTTDHTSIEAHSNLFPETI